MSDSINKVRKLVVYMGKRKSSKKGKLINAFYPMEHLVNDGTSLDEQTKESLHDGLKAKFFTIDKKDNVLARIGEIWSYDFSDENYNSIYTTSGKKEDVWKNEADIDYWLTLTLTARGVVEAQKSRKQPYQLESLDPIRRAYVRATSFEKAVIIQKMIHYIQTGKVTIS